MTNEEALRLLHIDRLHTEFWGGRWHWPSGANPVALLSYAPRSGYWLWWVQGQTGKADTYDAARLAAEKVIPQSVADGAH